MADRATARYQENHMNAPSAEMSLVTSVKELQQPVYMCNSKAASNRYIQSCCNSYLINFE